MAISSQRRANPDKSPGWPADKIERWPIARLIPYARNARTHSEAQIAQIAASLREWGWTTPVLADEQGTIIAGHGRILAARQLGFKQIPVIVARGWSDAQKRAYLIADNQLALKAGWDNSLLGLELDDLRAGGIDLGLLGFDAADLDEIFGGGAAGKSGAGSLAERFGVPPFSVLNARAGWWQARKEAWIALGIKSELGRGEIANDRGASRSARINDAADAKRGYGIPGRSLMPGVDKKTGRIMRTVIPGTQAKRRRANAAAG